MSLATTAGIVFIFVSTMRVGPFRTALIMNLEPLIAMAGSAAGARRHDHAAASDSAAPSCWRLWWRFNC